LVSFLVDILVDVRRYIQPERRKKLRIHQKKREEFLNQLNLIDCAHTKEKRGRKVLFFPVNLVEYAFIEDVILQAFVQASFSPIIVTPSGRLMQKIWQSLGWTRFYPYYTELELHARLEKGIDIDVLLKGVNSREDVFLLSAYGVSIGKYAISSLMRKTRNGEIDIKDELILDDLKTALRMSYHATTFAKNMVEKIQPDCVALVDRGYTPIGQLFDICLNYDIPVYTFNAGHRSNRMVLKRYTQENRDEHPYALSENSWERVRDIPWNEQRTKDVMSEFFDCYQSGEWYGEVGTMFNKKIKSRSALDAELRLDPDKKTAILFAHLFWDSAFFWGEDLFANFEEWFVETIRTAIGNDRINWIIKIHPANVVKNQRDSYRGENSEIISIKENFGELPPHIRLLQADTEISTYSLYGMSDYCLTVRGTPGIEAACAGVTVLTAGTGRYDQKGFTVDSETKGQYLERISNLDQIPPITDAQIELARRFAYGLYFCRSVSLTSVDMEYEQDEGATLNSKVLWKNREDLKKSNDVQFLRKWIENGDEDYFRQPC
jgi:hypothetical protein